ncbi:Por secretion system C-terminal sorting domain-containing protein [Hymenobacter daecheongensis DSM 21074]|uniref:Por secretion system C-terminal sorting domain-containing protein n=1 Tax=Hymenobacter daecheongensis DSM 21074 TaxID=1121955 RepID=A0A1M6KFI2_9BACT|nr:T9SS type A sorting domain-containing protein [Hymenobacter daecheongensis]SHJ57694.1 Por secretion system C-terminal sorting domain-containing protein [Hymenobacter daecheongensis DSM 21074]
MKLRLTLALLLPALGSVAQTLTNDGATLTVEAGATLYVAGTVQNKAGSTLTNAGTLQLTGDLTNAGTLASGGTLLFAGTTNQAFTPGAATVATLVVNNTGATGQRTLTVPTDLTVGTALTLQSGLLRTDATATLTLPDGATLSGEGPGQYVQGNLRIVRAAGSGVLNFGHGLSLDRTSLGQVTATRAAGLLLDNVSRTALPNTAGKSIDRIWTVETTTAPAVAVPVTLSWPPDDDNGLSSFSSARAWRSPVPVTAWAAVGTAQAATVTATSRSFSFTTAVLGRLTVSSAAAPLPVELTRFTAEAQGADALLQWATASEKNNDRFEVEASADGRTFRRIGTVAGHGTSTQPHEYQLLDKAIARYAASPVYYRLRQLDHDGTATYSPVRAVGVSSLAGLALFPNPTRAQATLTGAAPGAQVQVYDALGRLVVTATADATGSAALVLPQWRTLGVYVVRVGKQALRLSVVE